MLVTGIYKNKRNYDIYLDKEFAFTVSEDGLYMLKLTKGKEFNPDARSNEILQEDEVNRSKNRAMSMLSVTQKSISYLQKQLEKEGFSQNAVEKTIEFLKDYSLVNDLELGESIVRKENRQNKSKRQIKQKLIQRGIEREDQEAIFEGIEIDEKENALETALKKYRTLRGKPGEEVIRKVGYTLSYRGFSYDSANYAMSKIKEIIKEEDEAREDYEEI